MDNQSYIDRGDPPAEVLHFINSLSTPTPQSCARANLRSVKEVNPVIHRNPAPLFLLRLLSFLKTTEGRAWISTLPLPEQTAYAGVQASLERVLAVGHIIATIHKEQQ